MEELALYVLHLPENFDFAYQESSFFYQIGQNLDLLVWVIMANPNKNIFFEGKFNWDE